MKDLYTILGVNQAASIEDIKSAYRDIAKRYHPDHNKEKGAQELFVEATKAYDVLSDSAKRSEYDAGRKGNGRTTQRERNSNSCCMTGCALGCLGVIAASVVGISLLAKFYTTYKEPAPLPGYAKPSDLEIRLIDGRTLLKDKDTFYELRREGDRLNMILYPKPASSNEGAP